MAKQYIEPQKRYEDHKSTGILFLVIGFIGTVITVLCWMRIIKFPLNSFQLLILLAMFVAFMGFGVKSAIFPMHFWLPLAGAAPTPTTALLHAVAVVKSGVFALMRLTYFAFPLALISDTWVQTVTMSLAIFTIVYGSCRALKETHFKRRLAYSTISNLSYIIFGITLMSEFGLQAALLHLLFHSISKQ